MPAPTIPATQPVQALKSLDQMAVEFVRQSKKERRIRDELNPVVRMKRGLEGDILGQLKAQGLKRRVVTVDGEEAMVVIRTSKLSAPDMGERARRFRALGFTQKQIADIESVLSRSEREKDYVDVV
jgi:hypothetical protein